MMSQVTVCKFRKEPSEELRNLTKGIKPKKKNEFHICNSEQTKKCKGSCDL